MVDCRPTALAVIVIPAVPPFGETATGAVKATPFTATDGVKFPLKLTLVRLMLLLVPFVTVTLPKAEPFTAADIESGFGAAVNNPFPPDVLPGVNDTVIVAPVPVPAGVGVKVRVALYVVPFTRPAVFPTETVRVSGVVRLFNDLVVNQPGTPVTVYEGCAPMLVTITFELYWFDVKVTCAVRAPLTSNWALICARRGAIAATAAIAKQAVLLNENSGIRAGSMISPDQPR